MQYLLDRAKWATDGLRDELQAFLYKALADPQAIWFWTKRAS
jgi:hypothetical protein